MLTLFFWISPADNDYSNRKKNFSFGDRSLLKRVEEMAPRAFREVFRMTKRVFEIFMAECEPWLPPGLSSNGKSISPRLQILIFLYYVTGNIPFRHLALAAGVKKSTCQKIIRKVVDCLIDNGFVSKWITRITEVLHSVSYVYAVLPFYDVKCLCSKGREWGREESHSH